ncbi:MAG: ATP-binding protein [Firmicutes bacterium]|nr:ATP-binding protein [Bacillota bacterium]
MSYKNSVNFIVQRRKAEQDAASVIFNDALQQNPALLEVESALRGIILAEAKDEKINQKTRTALLAEKTALLKKAGITENMLNPPPHCAVCRDTAYVGAKLCDCVKTLALNKPDNVEIPLLAFSDIDFSRFDPAHRERNQTVYESVQKICAKYPLNKRRVIIISGNTGTGKTLLAGCAADCMLSRGFAVTAVTAFGFVNRALQYHTTFNEEKLAHLEPLTDSDLLVIDDLGTESFLKNITHEYLYSVLNERINSGKLTLITSNLSREGILARYGERIFSRLYDKNIGYASILNGADLRSGTPT